MSGTNHVAAIWHDVECGSYAADLHLWEVLADQAAGPVLDLGCGTGRVALHLARRGHRVIGVDHDPELLAALRERGRDLPVETVLADARSFRIAEQAALALAPMQVLQLLETPADREACLERVATALRPGARFAAAILEEMPPPEDVPPPLPDVREVDGWVYSSLAVEAAIGEQEVLVRRLRQSVSPVGELSKEPNEVRIATFPAAQLEEEARSAGLAPAARVVVAPTDLHVGSTVVVLEKKA